MNRAHLSVLPIALGLLLVPYFTGFTNETNTNTTLYLQEAYDPALYQQLQNMDALLQYIDRNYTGNRNSFDFPNYMGTVISRRFYHDYSYYSTADNWIAALAGKFIWKDLAAPVLPDDILKHPNASCSQQSIVLMACAKHFGLNFRKISFDHHYITEVAIGNHWHYIDPNMEVITKNESLQELITSGKFYVLYKNKLNPALLKAELAHPVYGNIDAPAAPHAATFQSVTDWLSQYFICLVFLAEAVVFAVYLRKDRSRQIRMGRMV